MAIYVLKKREDVDTGGNFGVFGYDTHQGFVVRASSEKDARRIASESIGDNTQSNENIKAWLNPELTTCEVVEANGPDSIILVDFWSG